MKKNARAQREKIVIPASFKRESHFRPPIKTFGGDVSFGFMVIFFMIVVASFSVPLFAGLVDTLNDVSNQIESSNSGVPQPSQPQAPPPKPPPANLGTPLSTSRDAATGNTSATYKNPDGSYTVRETDAGGNVVSEKKFGGAASNPDLASVNSATSTLVKIKPDGSVKVRQLPEASSTDTATGATMSVKGNADGTRTVTTTDKSGNVTSAETRGKEPAGGSAYDSKTGVTTSSKENPDGTRTVTTTDKKGNVLSTEMKGDELIGGSSYDPATGITTKSVKQADGSRLVTQTDREGKILSQDSRR